MQNNSQNTDVTPQPISHELYVRLKTINPEILGERLRRARGDKKISQRDLSNGLFTSAYLSSIELGKTRPTLATLEQLAKLLGKSAEYFLRPTAGLNSEEGMDEEHARNLELRQKLLAAQVYLEKEANEQVLAILEQVRPDVARLAPADQARFFYLLGKYYSQLQNYTEAIAALQEAQNLRDQLKIPDLELDLTPTIQYELGEANLQTRQVMKALNHFVKGLESLDASSNPGLRWRLLSHTAECYTHLNDTEQAQAFFQRAFEFSQQNTLDQQAAYFYRQGAVLSDRGDFQSSGLYFGRSSQIYEVQEEQTILLESCLNLAQLLVQSKEYEQAQQMAALALELSGNSTVAQQLKVLVLLATIHHRLKDLEKASFYLDKTTNLLGGGAEESQEAVLLGQYYQVAAELKADLNQATAAEDFFQKAIATMNNQLGSDDLTSVQVLAEVYYSYGQRLKDWNQTQKSLEYIEQAYRLFTRRG